MVFWSKNCLQMRDLKLRAIEADITVGEVLMILISHSLTTQCCILQDQEDSVKHQEVLIFTAEKIQTVEVLFTLGDQTQIALS